jgi:predicted metal-dependent peptidase
MADLGRAYVTLICHHPFYATVLLRLRRYEDVTAPTMWTDGISLGYNPTFVASMTDAELVGVLAHEVMHVVGLHPWRKAHREHRRWNVACDAVINYIVAASGLTLPTGCVPGVADTTPEALYEQLPPSPPEADGGSEGSGGGIGEVRQAPGTETERNQSMQEASISIRQAIAAAKAAGKLPAGMDRYCDQALEAKVPWREVLSRFLDSWAKTDYSWSRPNMRYAASGFILPSLWAESYGEIVVGADTSGSVGGTELRSICSEILGALSCYAERGQVPKATVAWFDHAVHPQPMDDVDSMMDLKPQGGGGTSFRVVFEWLATLEAPPRCCIMITDGYSDDFGRDPGVPVLWVLTAPHPRFVPPFGTITCVL